jgi:hypothetical protein
MKETISDIDLLIIRQCKKNKPSINILNKLACKRHALGYDSIDKSPLIHVLIEIVLDHGLIRDMEEFLTVDLNPDDWRKKYYKPKNYQENLIDQLISKIRCSPVDKFPRYPRAAWFRHKNPEIFD